MAAGKMAWLIKLIASIVVIISGIFTIAVSESKETTYDEWLATLIIFLFGSFLLVSIVTSITG